MQESLPKPETDGAEENNNIQEPTLWSRVRSAAKDFHRDETTMDSGERVKIGEHFYTIDYLPNYAERDFRFGFKALKESGFPVSLRSKSLDITGLGISQAKKVFEVMTDFIENRRAEHNFASVSFRAAGRDCGEGSQKLVNKRLSVYEKLLKRNYPNGVFVADGDEGRFFFTPEDYEWFERKQK